MDDLTLSKSIAERMAKDLQQRIISMSGEIIEGFGFNREQLDDITDNINHLVKQLNQLEGEDLEEEEEEYPQPYDNSEEDLSSYQRHGDYLSS